MQYHALAPLPAATPFPRGRRPERRHSAARGEAVLLEPRRPRLPAFASGVGGRRQGG
jgi:hypothetical protein